MKQPQRSTRKIVARMDESWGNGRFPRSLHKFHAVDLETGMSACGSFVDSRTRRPASRVSEHLYCMRPACWKALKE